MRNKKKYSILLIATVCSLVGVGTLCLTLAAKNRSFMAYGDTNPYVLNLNRSITSGEIATGEATFNTANGNPIVFKFDSAKSSTDSGLISLSTGSYFYNNTAITGINKIEVTVSGGSATLSYGNEKSNLNLGSQTLDTEGNDNIPFTINLDYASDYFKIDDVTGPFAIKNLKITYSCFREPEVSSMKAIAIGDVHISDDANTQQHLSKTLQYVIDNDIGLVLFNGDTVNLSTDENYTILDGILEDKFGEMPVNERPTFFFTMGNHEFYPTGNCAHEETNYAREYARFRTFANKWMPIQLQENENVYSIVVNGISFIAAFPGIDSTWVNNQEELVYLAALGEYSEGDLTKLEGKLDAAYTRDSSKPIVVMTHWPWGETYGGPNYGVGTESQIAAMKTVLGKYPQVINLTSHTHFSNLHDRDIAQTTYTTINVGTHCYGKYVSDSEEDEYGDIIRYENIASRRFVDDAQATAQHGKTHFGLGFSFESNQLLVNRINFAKGVNYNHGTFTIPYGITSSNKADKFYYSIGKRSGPSFTFSGNDNLVVTAEEKSFKVLVDVTFKDADQYYAAEGYKIAFENTGGIELDSFKWASLFWADLGQRNTYHFKNEITQKEAEYVVKLYPIDFYGHYGTPVSVNVTTTPDPYAEYEAKEEATGDLFFNSSVVDNKLDAEHAELDTYCLDTVDSSSGLSYKISADTEAGGWPSIQIQLNKSYDLTNSSLTLNAKFLTEGASAKQWMSFFLYNSEWEQITTEIGNDFSGSDNVWKSCLISNAKMTQNLKGAFDLSDIRFIRFTFNFEAGKGHNQSIWLDELHFVEAPTLQKNLEMVEMDAGMTTATTSTITYSDVYGSNSTSARKFTFEDTNLANVSPAWGRPRITFSPEHSGLSNIDLYNTTMHIDFKLSHEFFESDNAEKHTFVLKMYYKDGGDVWHDNLNVYNFFSNGAAGFTPENTDNGWIHLEQNMHIGIYENFDNLIRMEFQFFGLDDTTKKTAWVVIDNITFTPNA